MEDEYRGLLARYYDGELSEDVARSVELHVATCASCRNELLALRSLSQALTAAAEPVSTGAAEACWQDVQPKLGNQASSPQWRSWLPGLLLLALQGLLGVASLLLAIVSVVAGLVGGPAWLPDFALPALSLPGLSLLIVPLPGPALSGLLSICLFASAGVLYLIWLAAWWSRSHAAAHATEA